MFYDKIEMGRARERIGDPEGAGEGECVM